MFEISLADVNLILSDYAVPAATHWTELQRCHYEKKGLQFQRSAADCPSVSCGWYVYNM